MNEFNVREPDWDAHGVITRPISRLRTLLLYSLPECKKPDAMQVFFVVSKPRFKMFLPYIKNRPEVLADDTWASSLDEAKFKCHPYRWVNIQHTDTKGRIFGFEKWIDYDDDGSLDKYTGKITHYLITDEEVPSSITDIPYLKNQFDGYRNKPDTTLFRYERRTKANDANGPGGSCDGRHPLTDINIVASVRCKLTIETRQSGLINSGLQATSNQ